MQRCLPCAVNVTRLRFCDTLASSAAICFFHGYLLLPQLFASFAAICFFRGYLLLLRLFASSRLFTSFVTFRCTGFFEYANFRLPLSTFLVNVLRHFRINLSQLLVIAAAKVSHFEILCRVHNIEPTVGLFHCFYINSKNKGWMSFSKRPDSDDVDSFSCSASFPWHTGKNISRDPFPKSTEFNADHYDILVAHPALFQKFSEPFLCLVGMSRYYTLDEDTYSSFLHDDRTGIHGLFSGWYCGLAGRRVTLRVAVSWAKGVTTGTLVIILRMLSLSGVLFRPTGYSITYDSKEEPIEEEPLEEPNEKGYLEESDKETDSDRLSDARSRPGPAESGDSCEGKVKPKKSNPSEAQHKFIPSFTSSRCY
ncbi:hypothetical protein Tco_0144069 [Tanacetum coccineum]